jgi:hypothetical protein
MELIVINGERKESKVFEFSDVALKCYADVLAVYIDYETTETYFDDPENGIIKGCRIRDGFNTIKVMLLA